MATGTTNVLTDSARATAVWAPSDAPASPPTAFPLPPLAPTEKTASHPNAAVAGWWTLPAEPEAVAPGGNRSIAYRTVKRAMDIVGSLALLILLSPVLLTVFVVLAVTTRGKPLFWQLRAGHCGRPFYMVKFRTMVLDAAQRKKEVENEVTGPVFKNRRDPRITRLGRLLRKTSLDETPQLFHVLFGRMSLVGPRPLPVDEVARFEPWQRRRLAVKPGLTCLWQVSGRSDIGFDEWVRQDLWYEDHQSLWTDLGLLLLTPACVISGRGAY